MYFCTLQVILPHNFESFRLFCATRYTDLKNEAKATAISNITTEIREEMKGRSVWFDTKWRAVKQKWEKMGDELDVYKDEQEEE
jgi:hypothetical protein